MFYVRKGTRRLQIVVLWGIDDLSRRFWVLLLMFLLTKGSLADSRESVLNTLVWASKGECTEQKPLLATWDTESAFEC